MATKPERSVKEVIEDIFGNDLIRSRKFENKIKKVIQAERQRCDELQKSFPKIWCCDCGNQISFPVSDDYGGNCVAGGTHHEIGKYMFNPLTQPNNPK